MEWIKDYWYLILLGLVTAMLLFGYRKNDKTDTNIPEDHEAHTGEKGSSSDRGCCC